MKFQAFRELVAASRSRRRFDERVRVSEAQLKELVGLARLCPSTANRQAHKFKLVTEPEACAAVFAQLGWAAALKDWPGPKEGERPTAYVLILCDQQLAKELPVDDGIVAQTMLLGATAMGLGGCMFGNVKREALAEALHIDTARYHIAHVLAFGKPVEQVVIEELGPDGNVNYYRDEAGVHHVPKRSLDELIVE